MKKLLTMLLCLGLLVGCGSTEKPNESNESTDTNETVTVDDPDALIREVYDWYVSDIWNVGLCDIRDYMNEGTSATGEELDIEFTMTNLKKAMEKIDSYNEAMQSLDDDKYSDVKYTWSKMYDEIMRNYDLIKDAEIKPNDPIEGYNTEKLAQYHDKFFEQMMEY